MFGLPIIARSARPQYRSIPSYLSPSLSCFKKLCRDANLSKARVALYIQAKDARFVACSPTSRRMLCNFFPALKSLRKSSVITNA